MSKLTRLLILVTALLQPLSSAIAESSFFEQRYRGWIWFEEPEKEPEKEPELPNLQSKEFTEEEMQEIKAKNEKFSEELDLLKHVMIRYPDNLGAVRRYKEKEKIMLDNAMILSRSFMLTNFLNPDIADHLENPQNLYGRRTKAEIEEQTNAATLKNLANHVELFLFFKSDCPYCEVLEKHLARFAGIYGFKVEAVSADKTKNKYFKTHFNDDLIKALELKQVPTVIAVTNDSKMRFELARGAVSVADLESTSLLMARYLKMLKQQEQK